ncbi:ribonuclease, Rne/Rng family [Gordonia bronchialis DSM 43247]|uniref:Ribonuclease E n=1 Tax=Gordonia bronchialis (strain ATCC 25592 / DSM 43247 / BCRC 13721 / JCM 3198 / KCTC 3076 / NBRC 16047 / NCTC 10667) TaxID=526226 RepID=D0LAJ7_GORB4|nr:translation initiation factor IF-2 N-terminal domain-containing protein [Gordonia bronchialis]ACY21310.1 ribonuclease, Rne/Rng family [Gordonia bronchialis DSM 43247]MCC3324094.1 translation initiation factor IF-2 N-terminal domain-containing protein [Gordonia bronchialis]QGS25015.1 Rne/Rng family ribonuclease [Gordonia bronchialis]STQ64184.1 Ribonuclease G [Gordonia bronchialis]
MTDNGSPADANAASGAAEEFPSRLRVHALARILGMTSREVLAHLAELGAEIRSAQSSVDRELAQAVADRVRHHVEVDDASLAAVDATSTETPPTAPETPTTAPESAPTAPESAPTAPEDAPTAPEDAPTAPEDAPTALEDAPTAPDPTPETAVTAADRGPETPSLFSAASAQYDHPIAGDVPALAAGPLFLQPQAPEPSAERTRDTSARAGSASSDIQGGDTKGGEEQNADDNGADDTDGHDDAGKDSGDDTESNRNRRRRRGRRGRGRGRGEQGADDQGADDADEQAGGDQNRADQNRADQNGADTVDSGEDTDVTSDGGSDPESEDEKDAGESGARKKAGRPSGKKGKRSKNKKVAEEDDAGTDDSDAEDTGESDDAEDSDAEADGNGEGSTRRRRRRRRRKGGADAEDASPDDPPNTVVHEREPRSKRVRDEVQGISGSTRLEAKRQRRRDGRDAGRRRPPILTESEFLARREAVDRVMVVRERGANSRIAPGTGDDGHEHATPIEDYTQVAVLEDGVLVEHFVTTATSSSMVGNIYLGRVQNVLPGMEAAFVDIGRGRNGVLYAGEVNWDAAGLDGGSRKIEQALKPGDNVLVQVSKDPVGHKGARLTTQISLAGRYLVYVPGGSSTGISRKLPDVERKRLKQILAKLVPADAGVIIRTASEGVSAEELGADIARLEAKWRSIDESVTQAKKNSGSAGPKALYEEPDLLVRVVRDLFNEDFKKLVVEGAKAWNLVEGYVGSVAPDLMDRVEKFEKPHADAPDSFVVHRIDEQLAKALDRKVWLPSGGTLIIEHTEAMTVVDVNTGKFTGSGGNLEETVTRNNLEAAEEIVRQMRLRDIGGMIIVDFIDMVLESNRDLVLRRLTEALARDRTRHQVSEVTSLGLVQMTRKRLGTGLLEAFSTTCTTCGGRGVIVHANPVEVRSEEAGRVEGGSKRSRRGKRKPEAAPEHKPAHHPAEHPMFRAMAAHSHDDPEHVAHDSDAAPDSAAEASDSAAEASDSAAEASDSAAAASDSTAAAPESTPKTPESTPTTPPSTSGPAAEGDGSPRRRRRVVRRAASPTAAPEPMVLTAAPDGQGDAAPTPVTTFGPVSPTSAESAVAVRRRPRRRSAGRPAGPPPGEQ